MSLNHTSDSADSSNCDEGVNTPSEALEYTKYTANLDFVALTDHADMRSSQTSDIIDGQWQNYIQKTIPQYNDEASFIVFPGWEYTNTVGMAPAGGSKTGYGHKQVIFKEIDRQNLPAKRIGAFAGPSDNTIDVAENAAHLWDQLNGYQPPGEEGENEALTIIHTPAMKGEEGDALRNHQTDFDFMHQDFVRNVEIYSKWGSSEGEAPEGICTIQDAVMDFDPIKCLICEIQDFT